MNGANIKASWRILPLLGLGYLIAFMDRGNIGFAAKQMNDDLKFSATIYGLGGGLFFLSYAMFEVPANVLLLRFGARRWIARIMVTWGIFATAMMFIRTPLHFYVVRFLLGVGEAGFFPAVIFYLSQWFPNAQRGRAISRFYIAGPLASVLMGGISGSLLDLDSRWGLRGWQWLFMVQGLPAILCGIAIFFLLPDTPSEARWLTADEKNALADELADDDAQIGEPAEHDTVAALRHPRVLIAGLIGFATIGSYLTFFLSAPLILAERTGLSRDQIGNLVSAGGVLGAAGMLFTGWYSDRRNERFPLFFASTGAVGACLLLIGIAPSRTAVMASYLLLQLVWTSVSLSSITVLTTVVHRRILAVGMAAMNTLSQIGAFLLPFGFGVLKDATQSYTPGLLTLAGFLFLAVGLIEVLRRHVARGPRVDLHTLVQFSARA